MSSVMFWVTCLAVTSPYSSRITLSPSRPTLSISFSSLWLCSAYWTGNMHMHTQTQIHTQFCAVHISRLDLAKLGKHCWQFTFHSLPGLAVLAGKTTQYICTFSMQQTTCMYMYVHIHSYCADITGTSDHS